MYNIKKSVNEIVNLLHNNGLTTKIYLFFSSKSAGASTKYHKW